MIKVEIKRIEPVSEGAVATIANAFAEWLDGRGFQVTHATDTRSYEELAEAFVQDWG